jgi:hypothetical protein
MVDRFGGFVFPAFVAAVNYLIPVFFPFFSPAERSITDFADFFRKKGFLVGHEISTNIRLKGLEFPHFC